MDALSVVLALVAIFVIAQLFPKGAKVLKNGEAHGHGPEWTSAAAYSAQSAPYAVSDRYNPARRCRAQASARPDR